jgi:hypothetical protein
MENQSGMVGSSVMKKSTEARWIDATATTAHCLCEFCLWRIDQRRRSPGSSAFFYSEFLKNPYWVGESVTELHSGKRYA